MGPGLLVIAYLALYDLNARASIVSVELCMMGTLRNYLRKYTNEIIRINHSRYTTNVSVEHMQQMLKERANTTNVKGAIQQMLKERAVMRTSAVGFAM